MLLLRVGERLPALGACPQKGGSVSLKDLSRRLSRLERKHKRRDGVPEQESFVDADGHTCYRFFWRDDKGELRSRVVRLVYEDE